MIERAFERRFGAANDRSNRRRELPAGADAKGSNGVDQLTKEGGVFVHVTYHDGEAGRTALLTGVTEGRLHEVLHRDVDVGARADQYGVLPARFGEEGDVGTPRGEHERSIERARQNHRVHTVVGDEMTTTVVVSGRHEL